MDPVLVGARAAAVRLGNATGNTSESKQRRKLNLLKESGGGRSQLTLDEAKRARREHRLQLQEQQHRKQARRKQEQPTRRQAQTSSECSAKEDTWDPGWGSAPEDACHQWLWDTTWGALSNGGTIKGSCAAGGWADGVCSKTCCEALDLYCDQAHSDTWLPDWASNENEACAWWANDASSGALVDGTTITEACAADGWGAGACAQTCCFLSKAATCSAKQDSWYPGWGSGPEDVCRQWRDDTTWGALSNGGTLDQSCAAGSWGDGTCSKTCCEALNVRFGWGGNGVDAKTLYELAVASYGNVAFPYGWSSYATCESSRAGGGDARAEIYTTNLNGKNVVVLGFAGTDSLTDWWNDLDFFQWQWWDFFVHGGFAEYLTYIEDCVNGHVMALKALGIPLSYVTGHSLGGASATIYSLYLKRNTQLSGQFPLHGTYTYGAPGSRYPEDVYCEVLGHRYMHLDDMVPGTGYYIGAYHDITNAHVGMSHWQCTDLFLSVCYGWEFTHYSSWDTHCTDDSVDALVTFTDHSTYGGWV